MQVLAYVRDLMDRSKIEGAIDGVVFASAGDVEAAGDAEAIVVDLATHAEIVKDLRAAAPDARIVVYGRHTDVAALRQAVEDGADAALPRSSFFADPAGSVSGSPTGD